MAFVATGWTGVAAGAVLIALHVAFGMVVARWWAILVPVWIAVFLAVGNSGSEDLSGTDIEAFVGAIYVGTAVALVAAGVVAGRLPRGVIRS